MLQGDWALEGGRLKEANTHFECVAVFGSGCTKPCKCCVNEGKRFRIVGQVWKNRCLPFKAGSQECF